MHTDDLPPSVQNDVVHENEYKDSFKTDIDCWCKISSLTLQISQWPPNSLVLSALGDLVRGGYRF